MNTVREANRYDIDDIVDLLIEFTKELPSNLLNKDNNRPHFSKIVTNIILGYGKIFVGCSNNKIVGIFMCIRQPNLWNPDVILLQELAWYVLPDYRTTRIGYKLFKAFESYALDLLNNNKIHAYTLCKTSSSKINYEKLGLKLNEETWIGQ